ncbi:hypothetical protein [Nocardia huaxiensis]|uniref:Uncharacterized protein n=1 Tax=Nocardia huaxiensis TaxID=2755382 RepID=A0A7D6VNK3_9NOCA|nr:hypothetical protein [Nocardia huaxiensis]QLY33996.1 hypothetical protein H0264_18730 [Nocardia huaxiensis]UFS99101.1 hypothetical protein LPY97_14980 [Nocardia huaxiensis]
MSTFITSQVADLHLRKVEYRHSPTGSSVWATFDSGDPRGFAPIITVFLEIETARELLTGLAVALGEHETACRALAARIEAVQP